jgi:hypothetical protein
MAKKAKALTGAQGQPEVQADVQVSAVPEQARENLGFVDYQKSRQVIIKGEFIVYGELAGEEKSRHWRIRDAKTKKTILYLGMRKDGKGVYCRSSIPQICSEFKKAETVVTA